MQKILVLVVLSFISVSAFSKEIGDTLKIGQPCPNFIFTDVEGMSKKSLEIKDFKGKWLVLDFWNELCTACIASFPETNRMQKKYASEVQFLLVGYNGAKYKLAQASSGIKKKYNSVKRLEQLDLPIAYDSAIFDKYGINRMPALIIVDPQGIIRFLPGDIKEKHLKMILSGEASQMDSWQDKDYNFDLPFLVNLNGRGNGGVDTVFQYRSLFSKWTPDMPFVETGFLSDSTARIELIRLSLKQLYDYAFFGMRNIGVGSSLYGKYLLEPVLEIKNKSLFDEDWRLGKNYFCYSLIVPHKLSKGEMMKKMQNDLSNYFNFDVKIEVREIPCLEIHIADSFKVRYANISSYDDKVNDGKMVHVGSIQDLIQLVADSRNNLDSIFSYTIFDKTGIRFKQVDLYMPKSFNNIEHLKKSMELNGLRIDKVVKKLTVLVVKDR